MVRKQQPWELERTPTGFAIPIPVDVRADYELMIEGYPWIIERERHFETNGVKRVVLTAVRPTGTKRYLITRYENGAYSNPVRA